MTGTFNINITGLSTANIVGPAQTNYDSIEFFTIVLYFNNTMNGTSIKGATVTWSLSPGGPFVSTNVSETAGVYSIEIWVRDAMFDDYGNFTFYIRLNQTYYYNKSVTFEIKITGLTTSNIDTPTQYQIFDSDILLSVILSFNDSVKGIRIQSANISWSLSIAGPFVFTNVTENAGVYNISLWLRDPMFALYGNFSLYIRLNKSYHYNGTQTL